MGKEIIDFAPSVLWKHFYALTQIPRPSKHEAEVIKCVADGPGNAKGIGEACRIGDGFGEYPRNRRTTDQNP